MPLTLSNANHGLKACGLASPAIAAVGPAGAAGSRNDRNEERDLQNEQWSPR